MCRRRSPALPRTAMRWCWFGRTAAALSASCIPPKAKKHVWPEARATCSRLFIFHQSIPNRRFLLTIINYLYKVLLMSTVSNLNASFSALADPTRRAILARLALGEATVMELAKPFEMTQPAISQHLKVMEDAGLIIQRVDGTRRPRRLAKAGIEAMDQWLRMLRRALEKNYDRLDGVLAEMQNESERKTR